MCLCPKPNHYNLINKPKNPIPEFDCGKCPECLGKRASAWALRAVMQARESKDCCMVTLTYDTFKYDDKGNIIGENLNLRNVDKKDCQNFIKRLRSYFEYHYNKKDIKYIISAEYGKRTHRPHYHALLFGVKFDDLLFHKKSKRNNTIYTSKTLTKLWKHGICTVDSARVSSAIAKYCTKYCMKDFGVDDTFMLCSQNIGVNELLKAFNGLSYWIDGQEYPIPRAVWQRYIENKYHLNRKRFQYIDFKTGEILFASPTYRYLNREKDMYSGIEYKKEFGWKNPWKLPKPYEVYANWLDDLAFRINVKARRLYRAYRDRDSVYRGYLQYWKAKASQKPERSAVERVALLDDRKYHEYKTAWRFWANRMHQSGQTVWTERPRFEKQYTYPARTCPYPSRHIRASDRKKIQKQEILYLLKIVDGEIVPVPPFKEAKKRIFSNYFELDPLTTV